MTYFEQAGERMYEFASKIFPYTRSLTGQGDRDTLSDIAKYIAVPYENEVENKIVPQLVITDVPSGTQVFDWTVPKEWIIREAYIEDENGNHIIDMRNNNLHVLNYSDRVDRWVDLEELKNYVYVEEGQPDAIPYVASYYKERYGFCMSKNQLDSLKPGKYHMYVDSEFVDGNMNYAEVVIPGETDREIMFSTYFCHPSMANNECSGLALQAELIRYVAAMPYRKYTYRFLFNPETIGAIAYLSTNNHLEHLKNKLEAGFVLSCVGDNNAYSIVESKYADTIADRALKSVIRFRENCIIYNFHDRGSDERQYNAPGVDLPVVCYCRSKFGEFTEYHTSADDMNYVSKEGFQGSFEVMTECEPQLGKRGLYSTISKKGTYGGIMLQRDVISYADGKNNLFDMSERFGAPVSEIIEIIDKLVDADLMGVD